MVLTMHETRATSHNPTHAPATTGRVLHSARAYDLLAWLLLWGHERGFREKTLSLARIAANESVLDIGCGTGTLAILAKKHAGPTGAVHAIDASPQMLARAKKKARSAGVEVAFQTGVVEALPFPAETFDVVLSTLMLHHLPRAVREQCAREIRRVAKRGGRVVVADFGARPRNRTLLCRFHKHGSVDLGEIVRVLTEAGLAVEESGPMGIYEIQYVVANVP
jgi:ubiquinone/menaquinone biosynthesis C-methylase UbiE